MDSGLSNALMITVIGMSLVFAAIFLLWGMMALLVKIAPGKGVFTLPEPQVDLQKQERRRQAAMVAVAVALAHQNDSSQPHEFPEPPTALVSPWQAVMRTKMLTKKGQIK